MSLIGWSVIPDFATKRLLAIFHRFFRPHPPQPNTRAYHQHYAATFALVVLGYLFYNLVSSARSMPPNFYQILGVPPTVDESGLKAAFRQFAKKNHPDRPGVGRDGEELFIMVRDVYEALKDPVVRFAYDRFGPDVLMWTHCSTMREYIRTGLVRSSGYHIFVGAALVFWSLVGSESPVSFWRFTLYAALFAAEMSLVLSPTPSSFSSPSTSPFLTTSRYSTYTILHSLFPQRIAHQHVLFLHQLFLFLSIALSRVVPVLLSAFSPPTFSPQGLRQMAEQLAALSAIADRETAIMTNTVLHSVTSPSEGHESVSSLARPKPFKWPSPPPFVKSSPPAYHSDSPSPSETPTTRLLETLMKEMEELIIEANVKKEDGPLRSVWEVAVKRGRERRDHPQSILDRNKLNYWEDEVEPKVEEGEEGRGSSLPSLSRSSTGAVRRVRFPSFVRYSHLDGGRARSVSC